MLRKSKIVNLYKTAEAKMLVNPLVKKKDEWEDLDEFYPDTDHLKKQWENFAKEHGLSSSLEGFDKWLSNNSSSNSNLSDGIKDLINKIILPFSTSMNSSENFVDKNSGKINGIKYPSYMSGIIQDPDSLPSFSYSKWKEEIGQIESGGNYSAVNKFTNALGKFQFVPSIWWDEITRYAGSKGIALPKISRRILEVESAKKYNRKFLENPLLQEGFMKEYTEKNLLPQLDLLRSEQENNFPQAALLSDARIMGLFHFQGPNGTRKWLKTGVMQGEKINSPVPAYLKKIDK